MLGPPMHEDLWPAGLSGGLGSGTSGGGNPGGRVGAE
jgi:hypothetical protein